LKSTGIVRKIDELGRIVIPKEIRNVLSIHSNDDLEIFIDNMKIVLTKYEKSDNILNYSNNIVKIIDEKLNIKVFVTNKERFITEGDLKNKELDSKLLELIEERKRYESINKETINKISGYFVIYPIIVESDILGLLMFVKETVFTNEEKILTNIILKLIENR
jgi:transcriptional pleiotropic regulator of transition state genes